MLHVFITGGARGAGLTIARAFAAAGARVSVCDIDAGAVKLVNSQEPSVAAFHADVSSPDDVEAACKDAEARYGPIQALVNNCGVSGPTQAIEGVSLDDWQRTIDVNLTGSFLCIRRLLPSMKSAGFGSIINISSASARVGLPLRSPYVVTKGALLSLTTTLAREVGPSGVRVNAILPGAIRGERLARVIKEKALSTGMECADYEREFLRFVSLRTLVEPEDIASMAVFLTSPAAARITGQLIGVDGGVEWEA